jgi:excisionase family DNA binding protein
MDDPLPLLRVEQAAKRLNLSRTKTYSLVARGELPSITIGYSRRIRPEDLERFVAERATASAIR